MVEYITKDQVIEWFRPYGHTGKDIPFYVLDDDVFEMKPADVAPVRHGRWELYGNDDDISASYFCSLCGWNIDENEYLDYFSHYRYCPNCGAKMDEEVSE